MITIANRARHILVGLLVLSSLLVLISCGGEQRLPDVVATYEDGEVTRDEYLSWLAARRLDASPQERRDRLERIAMTELLATRAVARGADEAPAVRLHLARAEDQLLLAALRRHIDEGIEFTDEEARRAFEANPDNAFKPRALRLRNIFKQAPVGGPRRERVRLRMEEIRGELLAGADFAELARRESESQTRYRGGNMGMVDPSELPPDVAEKVVGLQPGEITEVIGIEDGWVIFRCFGIREERHNTFEDVADTVHSILRRRELKRRMAELEEELVASAAASYDLETAGLESPPPDTVVLRFSDSQLTVADLERHLAGRRPGAPPRGEMTEAALRRVMDRHIFLVMAGRRAREQGLDRDPEFAERVVWKRSEILALHEIEARVRERFTPPTKGEVRAFWESNQNRFRHPAEYRLSVIRGSGDIASLPNRLRHAKELAAALGAGEIDFDDAARAHSDHPSAAGGGDLGWVSRTQLMSLGTELFQTITAMRPGEISAPVQRDTELWIVCLQDARPGRLLEYSEARERAERQLGNQRVQALQSEVEAEVRVSLGLTTASIPSSS